MKEPEMLNLFIAASIVLAVWVGGAPFSQIFSAGFFGTFVAVYVITLVGVRLLRFLNSPGFMVAFYMLVMMISYFIGPVFKYVFNDMPTYKMTQNIPVDLILLQNEGVNTGSVKIVNKSNDPMIAVGVSCTIYFDNGKPIEHDFIGGFGGFSQYPNGYGKATNVVDTSTFIKYRSNPNNMRCVATDATFVKSPSYNIKLSFEKNPRDFKTDFYVTNKDMVSIKNIQFQCVNDQGRAMRVQAYPAYLTDARKETIIAPNTTVKFVSDEAFWNYSSCFVSNAIEG
jgi:hypothetical protein